MHKVTMVSWSLDIGKRNDLTGLINSHKQEARFGYPLVHLSIRSGLQVEEGLAEGGHIDVHMLTGDPTSVVGEMAWLQVTPPKSHEPEDGETS